VTGDEPHDKDCAEVLERVFFFLDHELDKADEADIQHHLEGCEPCLAAYDLEWVVKKLVARSCASEHAPEGLRDKVLTRIRQVQVEIVETRLD
jgi:mycothiol system anti-sigma-R factor